MCRFKVMTPMEMMRHKKCHQRHRGDGKMTLRDGTAVIP